MNHEKYACDLLAARMSMLMMVALRANSASVASSTSASVISPSASMCEVLCTLRAWNATPIALANVKQYAARHEDQFENRKLFA